MTPPPFITAVLLASAAAFSSTVHASTTEERTQRGDAAVADLNRGQPQPALEAMRREFPFLAEATDAYALGDVWSRPGPNPCNRQLATIAASQVLSQLFAEQRAAK